MLLFTFLQVSTIFLILLHNNPSVNGGHDPILAGLATPVLVNRVSTGAYALKLNNNTADNQVSRAQKVFSDDPEYVSFSYSLIMQYDPLENLEKQPHFIVRLYNYISPLTEVLEYCIAP